MNVGYTILGNFQDLNHSGVNYTQKQYDALLGQCLSWSSNYTSMNVSYSVDRYVLNPDPVKYYFRDVSKYSEVIFMILPLAPSQLTCLFLCGIKHANTYVSVPYPIIPTNRNFPLVLLGECSIPSAASGKCTAT